MKQEIKKAYEDILEVCSKYEHLKKECGSDFDDINVMVSNAKNHLMLVEWSEKYGLDISHEYKPFSYSYFKMGDYMSFSYYANAAEQHKNGRGRYISWSVDGKQPFNEWLLDLSFRTGAYMFGEDYDGQKALFQDFFKELKSYKPDFSDSHNKNLYWKLENAKDIFINFNSILKKYSERNKEEFKQREIKKLEEKLNKLKESSL